MTPLRRENSDILMKWKIVGDIKIGPYADEWHPDSDTLIPPDNVKESGDRK